MTYGVILQWVEHDPKKRYIYLEPHNVTLFDVRVFAAIIKVRIPRWDQSALMWLSLRETRKKKKWRHIERRPCKDRGRNCRVTLSQAKDSQEPPKAGRGKEVLYSLWWKCGPDNTLILNFYFSKLWKNKFLVFQAPHCVVIFDSSPRN